MNEPLSPLTPPLPAKAGDRIYLGALYGAAAGLALARMSAQHFGPVVVLCGTTARAQSLETELQFFLGDNSIPILPFPDWETLPYDVFSPHQDIISQRLETLYQLPSLDRGVLIIPIATVLQRLAPRDYVESHSLILKEGDTLNIDRMRLRLEGNGYRCVSQVMEHGEFAVRGSLLDLFPAGAPQPFRIDLFDDEIDSIRLFDPETQRTHDKVPEVRVLPAREFPIDEKAIAHFRNSYREAIEGDPRQSLIYRDVSEGNLPGGIEYYLPLFFEQTSTLFDYLPKSTLYVSLENAVDQVQSFWTELDERYESRRHNIERPLLPPQTLFLNLNQFYENLKPASLVHIQNFAWDESKTEKFNYHNFATQTPPALTFDIRRETATDALQRFLATFDGRVLFVAESEGRREVLLDLLRDNLIQPTRCDSWRAFLDSELKQGITLSTLDTGLMLANPRIAVITESQLFGQRVQQQRRRRGAIQRDTDAAVRNLTELNIGAPVVHQDHGVGRYVGLQRLTLDGTETEFLTLEYAGSDKLYVPVSSLHLISRYTGASAENAPLNKLGSDHWEKSKQRAAKRAHDVAAELLDIYARRQAAKGYQFHLHSDEYQRFCNAFPFEETPDQEAAIRNVLDDMGKTTPMDRLVCGDVGFGKTEVAMRAAFVAVNDGKQVAVLVPTTLLANQHFQNFRDRFAEWPVRVELLSRFRSKKEQDQVLDLITQGKVDIVVGTHKLLGTQLKYKNLGLVVVDEEHRFGVRQKEKLKSSFPDIDLLTLTATPIPRTLNMALSGLRDLSIIATPPAQRLAVKTFVTEWDDALIKEACQREIKRGGQVYFLHNDIETIEKIARDLQTLIPEAQIDFAHGQMPERTLERVMLDFYHKRFNILVCTTIVESGIDVPTANTIVINRADHFGLAQLHQLRGRVGRSHHRAYAYLLIPHRRSLTPDAVKRLEAIESLEELGAGFMLASHDLEIRGAGELLGEDQSGQIHEIGFTLYIKMLEHAVQALKSGKTPSLDQPLRHGAEIDIHFPALIPDSYLPDVHTRLTLYKRIANCNNEDQLRELQIEMIDRFGLLPSQTKTLFEVTTIKLLANRIGIRKIDLHAKGGYVLFEDKPDVDPMSIISMIQSQPQVYKLEGNNKLRVFKSTQTEKERLELAFGLLEKLKITERKNK